MVRDDSEIGMVDVPLDQLQLLKRLQALNDELDRKIALRVAHQPRPWHSRARAKQLPPTGDGWNIWLVMAGRGWGKRIPGRTGSLSRPQGIPVPNGRLLPLLGVIVVKLALRARRAC